MSKEITVFAVITLVADKYGLTYAEAQKILFEIFSPNSDDQLPF